MQQRSLAALLALCLTTIITASILSHAGPLDPPSGPITPSYKTLSDVEPRIPIGPSTTPGDATNQFIITQPGSYYLTANILGVAGKNAIRVSSPNVTIDLCGFSMVGAAGSGDGILAVSNGRLTVRNGKITNFARGLASGGFGYAIQDMQFAQNVGNGAELGVAAEVSHCTFVANGGHGLTTFYGAVITNCTATDNIGHGFRTTTSCTLSQCVATGSGKRGIYVDGRCNVTGCTATFNVEDGIFAAGSCAIMNNECSANGGNGIAAADYCLISGNNCTGQGSTSLTAGISVTGTRNRIERNNCANNTRGYALSSFGNFLAANAAVANSRFNYDLASGNRVGVIVTCPSSGVIQGSSGGAGLGSSDPWANFSY